MKGKLRTLMLSACLAGAVTITAGTAAAEPVEIRLGDFQSTTHIVSKEGTVKWMQAVEERTGGKVKFKHFPSEQAAKAKGLLDAVKSGILDAALIGPLYHSDRLPLNSVVGLPGLFSTALEGTKALSALVSEGPLLDEFKAEGVLPMVAFVLPPYNVLLKGKKVGMPADWQGLKIRTAGSTQALTARALGAAGVSIPGPEVYTALERGLLDGVFFPLSSVPAYNLQEVSKHISTNGFFGGYSFALIVREDLFESLPADVQEVMTEAGREIALNVAKAQDSSIDDLARDWASNGIEIFQFSAPEKAALSSAIANVKEEWVERVGKANPKASDVLAAYEKAVAH